MFVSRCCNSPVDMVIIENENCHCNDNSTTAEKSEVHVSTCTTCSPFVPNTAGTDPGFFKRVGGLVPWGCRIMWHVTKMLQFENWNLIENRFTRNTSNWSQSRRYLSREVAFFSAIIFTTFFHFFLFFCLASPSLNPPLQHYINV